MVYHVFKLLQLEFSPISNGNGFPIPDDDEHERKYERRNKSSFITKLVKSHQVHPRYSDSGISRTTLIVTILLIMGGFTVLALLTKVIL